MERKFDLKAVIENIFANINALTGLNIFVYDQNLESIDNHHRLQENSMYKELHIEAIISALSSKELHRETLDSSSLIYLYGIKTDTNIIFLGPVAHHILSTWEIHQYKETHKNTAGSLISCSEASTYAAISGNAPASIAFAQSDAYLKLISECHSEKEIYAIAHDAVIIFTKMAAHHQSMGTYSFTSIRCKKLIHAGLFKPITLSSLANELSVSKEYLATCFKNDYGITVTHYINEKKSELACKLLTNSDYSVNEIASYLCFHSASYFIKVFKNYIGVTPNEYRNRSFITGFDSTD